MVRLPPRPTVAAPPPRKMVFGAAAGAGAHDFTVIGHCFELDDEARQRGDPAHEDTAHLVRFHGGQRQLIAHLPQRLEDLWRQPSGEILGVGRSRGVLHIRDAQVLPSPIDGLPGSFASVWGSPEGPVFACGGQRPFWLCGDPGRWHALALPSDTPDLSATRGLSRNDVYAVGHDGAILHFDGHTVRRLDSPATGWLTTVAALPDGRVCIGGHGGMLLVGSSRGWRRIDTGTDAPLLSLAPHRGGACYLTPDGLWWFDGRGGTPHRLSHQGGRWLNGLGDGSLVIVQHESAWLFDGHALHPLDTTL